MQAFSCNSCNEKFGDEVNQRDHYKSEWHRYNLKRKVAGLPGVTSEWFERRQQALSGHTVEPKKLLFRCNVCKKEYTTSKAHENHVQSKSHMLKLSTDPGGGVEASILVVSKDETAMEDSPQVSLAEDREVAGGDPGKSLLAVEEEEDEEDDEWEEVDGEEAMEVTEGSVMEGKGEGTEGVSEGEGAEEEWDVGRCFFCGKRGKEGSMADCLAHMHKSHGFFVPDAEFLVKPEEMLQYLALKVTKGLFCLFCDDETRQFDSLAALRQHMSDRCHCKLRWGDGSGLAEEELEEFYDYSSSYENLNPEEAEGLVMLSASGNELVIKSANGGPEKVLGFREMAKYYRQRFRPSEEREGVLVNAVSARYRSSLGLSSQRLEWSFRKKNNVDSGVKSAQRAEAMRTRIALRNNVIRELPKNCTY